MALGAASGVLAALSFRWPAAAPLVLVAFTPLLLATLGGTRSAISAGAVTGLVGYAIVFAWLPEPLTRFQGISIMEARLVFGAAVVYHALQVVLFAVAAAMLAAPWPGAHVTRRAFQPGALVVLGAPAAWVLLEWGYPKVFPWSLGGALASNQILRQAADLGGVYGLGFTIILVNSALALAAYGRSSIRVRRAALAVAACTAGGLVGYGVWRIAPAHQDLTGKVPPMAVGIVQGAIPVDRGRSENAALEAWETYERLTRVLLAHAHTESARLRPELIVWPETTLPIYLREQPWYRARIEQLVNGIGRPLILGALDRSNDGAGELNTAYAVLPVRTDRGRSAVTGAGADGAFNESTLQAYHKAYLVPWAEYTPGGQWLPFLKDWRTTGEFVAGASRDALVLASGPSGSPPLHIAPSICVEALQAGWFNSPVRAGASVLLNITDDGWLAGSAGPELHLQLARMRAVETRRWLVRASNSGVSAVVDPNGEIVASLPFGEAGTLSRLVFPSERLTPYVRFGEWVVWMSAVIVLFAVAFTWRQARANAR